MEMRRLDRERDMVLPPPTVDCLMEKYSIPLAPCLKNLHRKFRDKTFIGSTNYELMMTYLEDRRTERQMIGPEEIQEWRQGNHNELQPIETNTGVLRPGRINYGHQKPFLSRCRYVKNEAGTQIYENLFKRIKYTGRRSQACP